MKRLHGDEWKVQRLDGMRQSQLCGALWRQLTDEERKQRNAQYGLQMEEWRSRRAQLVSRQRSRGRHGHGHGERDRRDGGERRERSSEGKMQEETGEVQRPHAH